MEQIVVGVDGSPGSGEALRFALEEARLRQARVVALYAWRLPVAESPGPFALGLPTLEVPLDEVAGAYEAAASDLLDNAVAEASADIAGVEIERRLVEDNPVLALLDASEGADLLVVGTRGHGGFAGLLLGSVSAECVHHARCPVIVVPRPRESRPGAR